MAKTDSWWLKIERAQKHMEDLRLEAGKYNEGHPYETVPVQNVGRWALRFTEQPNPMIATIIGDFIHNVRSAMDHVVVGFTKSSRQRQTASFPCLTENIWARDSKRRYLVRDSERRRAYQRSVAGLTDNLKAVVKLSQPYMHSHPQTHIYAIISRLDNADKHKQLTVIGAGLEDASYTATPHGWTVRQGITKIGQFLNDAAEIVPSLPGGLFHPEMDVELSGTASIHVKLGDIDDPRNVNAYSLLSTCEEAIRSVRALLTEMENRA